MVISGKNAVLYLPGGETVAVLNFELRFTASLADPNRPDMTLSGDNIEISAD